MDPCDASVAMDALTSYNVIPDMTTFLDKLSILCSAFPSPQYAPVFDDIVEDGLEVSSNDVISAALVVFTELNKYCIATYELILTDQISSDQRQAAYGLLGTNLWANLVVNTLIFLTNRINFATTLLINTHDLDDTSTILIPNTITDTTPSAWRLQPTTKWLHSQEIASLLSQLPLFCEYSMVIHPIFTMDIMTRQYSAHFIAPAVPFPTTASPQTDKLTAYTRFLLSLLPGQPCILTPSPVVPLPEMTKQTTSLAVLLLGLLVPLATYSSPEFLAQKAARLGLLMAHPDHHRVVKFLVSNHNNPSPPTPRHFNAFTAANLDAQCPEEPSNTASQQWYNYSPNSSIPGQLSEEISEIINLGIAYDDNTSINRLLEDKYQLELAQQEQYHLQIVKRTRIDAICLNTISRFVVLVYNTVIIGLQARLFGQPSPSLSNAEARLDTAMLLALTCGILPFVYHPHFAVNRPAKRVLLTLHSFLTFSSSSVTCQGHLATTPITIPARLLVPMTLALVDVNLASTPVQTSFASHPYFDSLASALVAVHPAFARSYLRLPDLPLGPVFARGVTSPFYFPPVRDLMTDFFESFIATEHSGFSHIISIKNLLSYRNPDSSAPLKRLPSYGCSLDSDDEPAQFLPNLATSQMLYLDVIPVPSTNFISPEFEVAPQLASQRRQDDDRYTFGSPILEPASVTAGCFSPAVLGYTLALSCYEQWKSYDFINFIFFMIDVFTIQPAHNMIQHSTGKTEAVGASQVDGALTLIVETDDGDTVNSISNDDRDSNMNSIAAHIDIPSTLRPEVFLTRHSATSISFGYNDFQFLVDNLLLKLDSCGGFRISQLTAETPRHLWELTPFADVGSPTTPRASGAPNQSLLSLDVLALLQLTSSDLRLGAIPFDSEENRFLAHLSPVQAISLIALRTSDISHFVSPFDPIDVNTQQSASTPPTAFLLLLLLYRVVMMWENWNGYRHDEIVDVCMTALDSIRNQRQSIDEVVDVWQERFNQAFRPFGGKTLENHLKLLHWSSFDESLLNQLYLVIGQFVMSLDA